MNPANSNHAMTDSALLKLFLKGDGDVAQDAFRQLVIRYERLVWTVCRRQLSNHSDIEDAFQTTFMLLATRAHRIRNPQAIGKWLYGVAWKTSSRTRSRQTGVPVDEELSPISCDESPFDKIAKQHQIETVDRHLSLLDETCRTPLILYYYAGFTTRQIAGQMGLSVSAIEGRLRRGKAKLRVSLTGQGFLLSSTTIAICLSTHFQANPVLTGLTCERWLAATLTTASATSLSGAMSSISGSLDTGTKIMICKTAVLLAIVSMISVGGVMHMHSPPVIDTSIGQARLNAPRSEEPESVVTLKSIHDDDDESLTAAEALHLHLLEMLHGGMIRHVHGVLDLLHSDDLNDGSTTPEATDDELFSDGFQ